MNRSSSHYPYVIAGGAKLDEHHPEWYHLFDSKDLVELDMNDHRSDIVGILAEKDVYIPSIGSYDTALGMACPDGNDDDDNYKELNTAWRDYIRLRQCLPPVPEGYTFVGSGGLVIDPRRRVDAYTAYHGDTVWNHIDNASIDGYDFYYCLNADYAEEYIDILKEHYTMDKTTETEAGTRLTLRGDGDGVSYECHDLSEDDIAKLMEFVSYSTTLRDAGFDVKINGVCVGCMEFTQAEIYQLYAQYTTLKEQRDKGFTVTLGDRVEFTPEGDVYIVACINVSEYLLISLSNGNRWNTTVVKNPEDYKAIPFKSFLSNQNDIEQWRKV